MTNEKILRVDMDSGDVVFEDIPQEYEHFAGRAFTSNVISDEVDPECHPLGPNNKLVFSSGIITGTSAPSSGRLSVGSKSPLTGGIKESNVGTDFSQALKKLQIRGIIVEGQSDEYKLLKIDKDGVELVPAEEWSGIGLYEAFDQLRDEFGDVSISGVGIAAEMSGFNSGIAFNDPEGLSSRYAGRGGLGAVMASRGLKYIVVDDNDAPGVEIKDRELFKKGRKKVVDGLQEHDVTKTDGALSNYGTSVLINIVNEVGALPHYNFSKGQSEEAEKVSGERKVEEIEKRGGENPHTCSPGCIIQCSEVWTKEDGSDPVGALEYESVWALGPNCGIFDLDVVGELNRKCNDLGMDTIETGATIAVAMEGELLEFGDGEAALELLEEVRENTPRSKLILNGAKFAGDALGVNRVPVVKNQAMPAYDPRAVKGIGITYATSTMGADHTAGYSICQEVLGVGGKRDPLEINGKPELSREMQATTAAIDSVGHCLFSAFALLDIEEALEGVVEEVNGVLDTDMTIDDVVEYGQDILKTEREFNKAAGFTKQDDRIPEFMREEKLPPHNVAFEVSNEQLDSVFEK
ncbi:aldehyde ferredoxin oxidoreductase C-terminal domain-containing protein [Methanonatronarchaeum sp. AMET-Sl]|uniref:aldehyde ferredoxin oxidoreductase family protein n=1 Tax=Methanonatronarchaeum sp. AMET-Sl TaxID=3037654 RepID=UPI00244DA999|nr:aldehyde ferredoxin oxidoreductase C-terminal domain-containing protein [Methanonatronarchaeum sp. AMET-Sl]WGI17205.1 aldehyde ferredoxin oxidoreductase C-terminal domain-containing protein [Methanonatronarchaeum sp. AMET-Sl]